MFALYEQALWSGISDEFPDVSRVHFDHVIAICRRYWSFSAPDVSPRGSADAHVRGTTHTHKRALRTGTSSANHHNQTMQLVLASARRVDRSCKPFDVSLCHYINPTTGRQCQGEPFPVKLCTVHRALARAAAMGRGDEDHADTHTDVQVKPIKMIPATPPRATPPPAGWRQWSRGELESLLVEYASTGARDRAVLRIAKGLFDTQQARAYLINLIERRFHA